MPSNDTIENEETEVDILPSILNGSPFKIRSNDEKLEILKKGRPLPTLSIVKRDGTRGCNRTFQTSWYSIHKWLCASQSYNKLFCWPCILMRPETTSWSSTGNDDMKRFTSLATKHSICKSHLKAITEYDATLTNFGFSPEFMDETTVKCKEEEDLSNQSEADSFEMCFDYKSKHKKIPKSVDNDPQTKVNCTTGITTEKTSSEPKQPNKIRTKITFKTWQELNKDLFPVSRTKFFEDYKLFKWKKRVARQELKNARLASEKLKVEIEVLKAKAEYYRSLKSEIVTLQSMPQLPSSAAVAL